MPADLRKALIANATALDAWKDITPLARNEFICWVENSYPNVTYFNEVDKGGHFAAWEEPELFCEELRVAFRSVR